MFKLTELVFSNQENVLDKLNNVYGAMHSLGLSLIFLIVGYENKVDFLLGAKSGQSDEISNELGEAFEKTFHGNFPGSELQAVTDADMKLLLDRILPVDGSNAVTALTSIPSLKDKGKQNIHYTQGIEKFIDTMQGKEYAIMIISNPVGHDQLARTKEGYEELYTELFPLAATDLTIGKSDAESASESELEGYTETIGRSISKTQSYSRGTSTTKSESRTKTIGMSMGTFGSINGGFSDAQSTGATTTKNRGWATIFNVGRAVAKAATSTITSSIGAAVGVNLGVNITHAKMEGIAKGEQENWQQGTQEGKNEAFARNAQQGRQQTTTQTDSTSSTIKMANKSVQVLLSMIDEHLERIKQCENYGMWASAAYFIAPNKESTVVAASAYKGIINGEGSALEASSMSTWFKDDNTKSINLYLRLFAHPQFYDPEYLIDTKGLTAVSPATMVNTKELCIQCGIPYRSVAGVPVRELAEFGRNIYSTSDGVQKKISVGCIYHMGKAEKATEVSLDIERLREHTFVTGSTGSGKSNAVYEIISRLWRDHHVPTLVIEPAKGEYKQVFGSEFHVYGTNPEYTDLMRINPFKFEKEIHVLEHIDRLIDIFNVCWPMYAAMPAVLKEAVELAYIKAGWDLDTSQNRADPDIYPCFKDVLAALRNVISHSDYSQESCKQKSRPKMKKF